MSIANVSIVGNLVKSPQQVQFQSGKIKTTMFVAVNTPMREKRGGEPADFYKVETWGKLAEVVARKLDKGNQITANGRLSMERWTDKQGKEHMTPTIAAADIAFPQRAKTYASGYTPKPLDEDPGAVVALMSSPAATTFGGTVSQVPLERVVPASPVAAYAETPPQTQAAAYEEQDPSADNDDDDSDNEYVDEDDGDSFGEPNSATRPVPMRSERSAPG